MKKFTKLALCLLTVLAMSVSFAACDDGEPDPSGGEGTDPTPHSVTVEAPDGVDARASATTATAGVNVTVTVDAPAWLDIASVEYNDKACTANTDGTYSFAMPDEDVTVEITVEDSGVSVDEDDGMTWISAPAQIAPYEYGSQTYEIHFGNDRINASIDSDGNLEYAEVYSTNEAVIPADAISGVRSTSGLNNGQYTSAAFTVDLSKVSAGSATLVFNDTDNDRTIAKYVTVTEYGTIVPGTLDTAQFSFDLRFDLDDLIRGNYLPDDVDLSTVYINFNVTDRDYIYGSAPEFGFATESYRLDLNADQTDFENEIITIDYVIGHRYTMTAAVWYQQNGNNRNVQLYFGEYVGPTASGNAVYTERNGALANLTINDGDTLFNGVIVSHREQ